MSETVTAAPRIPPLENPPEEVRHLIVPAPARYGDRARPQLMQMMLHNPGVAKRFRPIPPEERMLAERDQELAILRTAWVSSVPFIWGEHVRIAKTVGFTDEEIERVTVGSSAPGWSEHDRAVLRAAEELRAEATISDETWAVLAKTLDYARLLELPALIGQYQTLGYLQNALKAPLWPGNPGLSAR